MKKVLWVTGLLLPEASRLMNEKTIPFGGWLDQTSKLIGESEDVKLFIASSYAGKKIKYLTGENITYVLFPKMKKYKSKSEFVSAENIINEIKPDFIHIFGSELPHSYVFSRAANKNKISYGVNIQGLVSLYSEQVYFNLPIREILLPTIRSIINNDSIRKQKKTYKHRGKYEEIIISNANYVFGRTNWDFAYFSQVNPQGQYIKWNETLRKSFYSQKWVYKDENKYNIFVSQGKNSIKGAHQIVKATALLKEKYPEIKVRISGTNILNQYYLGIRARSQYARYVNKLIKKYDLTDHIKFIGIKNESEMLDEYLKSSIVVLPSSIENSPNSLGEAMILGIPTISSYVGGVMDFVKHDKSGFLYNTNEHNMLAYYIEKVFNMKSNELDNMSKRARESALKTHNVETNNSLILDFYKNIA